MSDTENPTGADTPEKPTPNLKADLARVKTAAETLHLVTKKLIELCVESSKVIDLCVEGDKLLEASTGAIYHNAIKGVREGLALHTSIDIPSVPSRKATGRKRELEALQAANRRLSSDNGNRKAKARGAWDTSEEGEDEDDEDADEDQDVDSDEQAAHRISGRLQSSASHSGVGSGPSLTRPGQSQLGHGQMREGPTRQGSQFKQPRKLPQIPSNHSLVGHGNEYHVLQRPTYRPTHPDSTLRTHHGDVPHVRTHSQPGTARQTFWSQILDTGRGNSALPRDQPPPPVRDTFVQPEPTETVTKAFAPTCLLSAREQDNKYQSAKRQEEIAPETGDPLVNVLNKHPPPQTGLLDAITAHEREQKREGWRERGRPLAEDRQRRFDELQRQQLDQTQQGASVYGGQFGYNPMMGMNAMMAGCRMNPMMAAAGMVPLNPMMTGQMGCPDPYTQQLMLMAQQTAQEAYQQTMMAFSVAQSQVGGEGGGSYQMNANTAGMHGMNPGMGGGMGSFDPRMSMAFPMMGMGMGGQMGGQMPIGMQTTGMSAFPPRGASPINAPQPQRYGARSTCGAPRRPV